MRQDANLLDPAVFRYKQKFNEEGLQYYLHMFFKCNDNLTINYFFLVFFIICSYKDETSLYSTITSSYQSIQSSMGNVIFIFIRWSHHFVSYYTTQFPLNVTYPSTSFPILHLLPMDSSTTSNLSAIVLNYQQQIISSTSNITFTDDVRF